jgi:hypothetical protein
MKVITPTANNKIFANKGKLRAISRGKTTNDPIPVRARPTPMRLNRIVPPIFKAKRQSKEVDAACPLGKVVVD